MLEILEVGLPPEILEEAEEILVSSYREVLDYDGRHHELEMEIP